ncbi:hypothetical protein M409DRAFT_59914 [Zasmidium cellare ATCC 36951]|uniref:Formate/nitrite transporter n=1 Tax=Zasmidium cellare ATCC 36951 TaxID=1080233 RepID=A0A6A6C2L7_ZASCE|nr:uncharacterized protein M409DRAFT_59914 [Zasmidium cellare ATCC 36951]KAF2160430.1 hypothetical protein M409DRAFT_59914 [Zasmidium cellare ATCC 36951]
MAPSTGSLPPHEAAQAVSRNGVEHLSEPIFITFVQNIYGAPLLSAGGLLAVLVGAGFAGIQEENNPGIQRLLQGAAFPVGLVMVYFVGAELFTGYPMWFTLTALQRKGRVTQYVFTIVASWVGNLLGTLFFSLMSTKATEALYQEPWRSAVISQVTEDIIEQQFHIIMLRAVFCGWLVTVAMFLGTQNQDGISRALCLHFPFFISTVARFPHTVEYMYLVSTAMILGAPLSVGGFIWKVLVPLTLGNVIGGGLFTGAYLWLVHLPGRQPVGAAPNGSLLDDHE